MTPVKALEKLLPDVATALVHGEGEINSMTAMTNASMWGLDEFQEPTLTKISDTHYDFSVAMTLSGERDRMPFCGDMIEMTINGKLVLEDGKWTIEEYEVVEPQLNF